MQSGTWPGLASLSSASSLLRSMLPLNGWRDCGCLPSGMTRFIEATGAGRVEMRVVGHDLPLAADGREEDALGGAALVRRNDVDVAGQVFDRRFEPIEAVGAGVRVVAAHYRGPLLR